ncbi:unnamed protein product [Polarella glacialis]|uniref:Uncharacterized protein n=1 Tax=Polarella glacialis TaxID=89957 RepID=A0A813ENH0_POLGL|nr:unnamed protein product [Polarella glacialis]CAE8677189.1 unnamed protein product [Polarella glacialis]
MSGNDGGPMVCECLSEWLQKPLVLWLGAAKWFADVYFLVFLVLIWYKANKFLYASDVLAEEAVLLVFLFVLQRAQLALGVRGCRTQSSGQVGAFLWLAIPLGFFFGYHLSYQVYVLQIEIILATAALALLASEVLLALAYGLAISDGTQDRGILVLGATLALVVVAIMSGLHLSVGGTAF